MLECSAHHGTVRCGAVRGRGGRRCHSTRDHTARCASSRVARGRCIRTLMPHDSAAQKARRPIADEASIFTATHNITANSDALRELASASAKSLSSCMIHKFSTASHRVVILLLLRVVSACSAHLGTRSLHTRTMMITVFREHATSSQCRGRWSRLTLRHDSSLIVRLSIARTGTHLSACDIYWLCSSCNTRYRWWFWFRLVSRFARRGRVKDTLFSIDHYNRVATIIVRLLLRFLFRFRSWATLIVPCWTKIILFEWYDSHWSIFVTHKHHRLLSLRYHWLLFCHSSAKGCLWLALYLQIIQYTNTIAAHDMTHIVRK